MVSNPLRDIRILHIEPDKSFAVLVSSILRTFGFEDLESVDNGKAALRKMATKDYDLVICEWKAPPINGLEFTNYIRHDKNSPDIAIPIIMVTSRAELKNIQKARDLGITEFLAKPFSVNALRQRIITVIERPREFVISDSYCGPSRRRKTDTPPIKERRSFGQKSEKEHGVRIVKKGNTKIISPNFKLKRKLGVGNNIEKIISLEKIREAETIIDRNTEIHSTEAIKDITTLKRKFNVFANLFAMNKNSKDTAIALEDMTDAILKIKGTSGIYGYTLATNVARTLFSFCGKQLKTKKSLEIIDVHIEALNTIYEKNIRGEFGEIGRELLKELDILVSR